MPLWRGGRGTEKELEFPLRDLSNIVKEILEL